MAEEFTTVFDFLRTEPIVDQEGLMTLRFAQLLSDLAENSNSTETIIEQQVQTLDSPQNSAIVSELTKRLDDIEQLIEESPLAVSAEQQKIIEDNQQLSLDNPGSMAEVTELKKRLSDIENLIAQETSDSAKITELTKLVDDIRSLI